AGQASVVCRARGAGASLRYGLPLGRRRAWNDGDGEAPVCSAGLAVGPSDRVAACRNGGRYDRGLGARLTRRGRLGRLAHPPALYAGPPIRDQPVGREYINSRVPLPLARIVLRRRVG